MCIRDSYTTHYMEEAERLCDRIGIIDHGKIAAEGTRRELIQLVGQHDRIRLRATGDLEGAATAVAALAGVRESAVTPDGIDVIADNAADSLAGVLGAVVKAGVGVTSAEVDEPNLEAVFLHLTGRALRD